MKCDLLTGLLVGLALTGLGGRAWGEAFAPVKDEQVLERLRSTPLDSGAREIRSLRQRLNVETNNLPLALQLTRLCIERSRSEADPRYVGRAQAALAPWWEAPQPPVEVLVLRATIKQSQHDFTNALADLDTAIQLAPRNTQAWLTRATILTVLGDYPAARRACLPLAQLAPGLVALTATATVSSLNGEAERAGELLRRSVNENASASIEEQVWALTVLAENAARLGQEVQAEKDFKQALALGQRDPYLLGAYSDLLLELGRPAEVVALLEDETKADGLLLRLALAEAALPKAPAALAGHIVTLRARFEAGQLRGDFFHQREEARFQLHLLKQPAEALRLAQANWQVQREPADLRLLLESALAAGNPAAAQPALDFIRSNRLQDVTLASLTQKLDRGGKP